MSPPCRYGVKGMERPITRQADQSDYVEAYLDGLVPGEHIEEEMEPDIVEHY